jgi:geranylgeranyl diphosphate synthase type I
MDTELGSIRELFSAEVEAVDRALRGHLARFPNPPAHYGMVKYHLGFAREDLVDVVGPPLARGKRLRAITCMLICRALAAPPPATERLMIAGEMLHAASLAHDDIQDEDPLRWGRPTLWSLFGVGQALNTGDALVAMTYQLLVELPRYGVSTDAALDAIRIFNDAHIRMCEGQHLDMASRDRLDVSVDEYMDTIAGKTAAMIEWIAHVAARIAAHDPRVVECYRRFGHAFGMLYQICDDIRAVWIEPNEAQKQVGGDVRLRKATLPLVLGARSGAPRLDDLLAGAAEDGALVSIANELRHLGVLDECRAYARERLNEALEMLRLTGRSSREHDVLEQLVRGFAGAAGVDGRVADAPAAE